MGSGPPVLMALCSPTLLNSEATRAQFGTRICIQSARSLLRQVNRLLNVKNTWCSHVQGASGRFRVCLRSEAAGSTMLQKSHTALRVLHVATWRCDGGTRQEFFLLVPRLHEGHAFSSTNHFLGCLVPGVLIWRAAPKPCPMACPVDTFFKPFSSLLRVLISRLFGRLPL